MKSSVNADGHFRAVGDQMFFRAGDIVNCYELCYNIREIQDQV